MDDQAETALATPRRNRYVQGHLLTPESLEAEQRYGIGLRRLANRLVHGHGVVCGLGVEVGDGGAGVRVLPGVAVDGYGREIVVAEPSAWLPAEPGLGSHALVAVGYEETLEDPAPILVEGDMPAEPTTIAERYRIALSPAGPRRHPKGLPDRLVVDGRIDPAALAEWVTERPGCTRLPDDPSVPLARVRVADSETAPRFDAAGVDITVRRVVLSNAVLLELLRELSGRPRSG
jgi:hypothetical protein